MHSFGDYIFEMAKWLRTTPLPEFSIWISNTPLSLFIGKNFWFIPIVQTIHILAIATSFGSVAMINLRILGVSWRSRTVEQTARRFLPWIWWSFLVLILTGLLMIIGEPVRELINPIFWMKMILVIVGILVSLGFQSSVRRNGAGWDSTRTHKLAVRVGAGAVIVLWCAIMLAGRWIAYAPV